MNNENTMFSQRLEKYLQSNHIVVCDPVMKELYGKIRTLSRYDTNLIIYGESGVGKNHYAYCVHALSHRSSHPFLHVNCSTITPELFESELFGYESGSFSGAAFRGKKGLLETADKGTLFLDEIAEMPLSNQVKLLQFLETGKVRRVGGSKEKKVDVRIISATNTNLPDMILHEQFREDLYYRIVSEEVYIPPLRNRPLDVSGIVENWCTQIRTDGKRNISFSPAAVSLLQEKEFPGNIRELLNLLERCYAFAKEDTVTPSVIKKYSYIPPTVLKTSNPLNKKNIKPQSSSSTSNVFVPLREAVSEFEKDYIKKVLERHSMREAAEILGISLPTLYRKRKQKPDQNGNEP